MARLNRADVFDPMVMSAFHCVQRCVRRCFLCGCDAASGKSFDHRKRWLEERLELLAGVFGIDVLAFAILSNHFHVVLRNRPDVVEQWSDVEVASRWLRLFPLRKTAEGLPEAPSLPEIETIVNNAERLKEIRRRLSDISWFMRSIAEPIARRANREDEVTGHFWNRSSCCPPFPVSTKLKLTQRFAELGVASETTRWRKSGFVAAVAG